MTTPAWRRYLRFWGRDIAADVDEELAFHLESRVQEFIALGMTPDQARAAAHARFGNLADVRTRVEQLDRANSRTDDRTAWWSALRQDLRYAIRSLRHAPGFTLVAVLTLMLGIGANTAIFSVVRGVLLRPLPFHEPDRLVRLFTAFRGSGEERYSVSQPEFMDYKGQTALFSNVAAYTGAGFTLTGDGEPERLRGMTTTRDYFSVLGVRPARGRLFQGADGRSGTEPVVVLSDELWRNRFGADPALLDRTLQLNGISRRVIGILPPGVALDGAQAYIPIFINPDSLAGRSSNYLSVVARLRDGVTQEQAARDFDADARRVALQYPGAYPASMGRGGTVVGMQDVMVGDVRPALLVLLGAVCLILLIACANVANLLLARGEARQREIAVRLALGASRTRILAQLLTESLLLALVGSAGGMLLATWGIKLLLAISPDSLPRMEQVRIDAMVALATLGLALLSAMLFGLAPALRMARPDLHASLKDGARTGSASSSHQRLGRILVSGEIALAVVVVIGATLLVRSFQAIRSVQPGFRTDHLLAVDLSLPRARYDGQPGVDFYRGLIQRFHALPGVQHVAATADLPPQSSGDNWDLEIAGRARRPGESPASPQRRIVTSGFFEALGVPLLRGRLFDASDQTGSPPVAIINEAAARHFWPGEEPVGQRFRFLERLPWVTVVGVVADMHSMGLTEPVAPEVYLHHEQLLAVADQDMLSMYVVLHTAGDPLAIAPATRAAIHDEDPLLAITGTYTMEQVLRRSLDRPRFTMTLLTIFGIVALSLAAIGVYGLMSYAVKRRTREIGIRLALGASPREVLLLMVGHGMKLAAAGVLVGLAGAFLAGKVMVNLLFGITPADPLAFALIPVVLLAVALLASWIPARRATLADPTTVLRAD